MSTTKFEGCAECKFSKWGAASGKCRGCDFGELFQPFDRRSSQPDDNELMEIYAKMVKDDE